MPEPVTEPTVRWIDQHCHLASPFRGEEAADPASTVASARDAGVVALVDVGTDAATSAAALGRAASLAGVWATAGVHPHDAVHGTAELRELLEEHRGAAELVAVGECGLDHHYDNSPRDVQRRVFAEQVGLANEYDLPLVIHTRDAWDDTFEVLDEMTTPRRTVFHCFTGGPREADRALARGALISISGIVTFAGAGELREAVLAAPLDSLMVETDSPYLAPVPHRGRVNCPALVGVVGAAVAEVRGVAVAEVAAATTATARRFFGLPAGVGAADPA